ncbi:hypothetical protein E2562_025530 [Oryza meyeriana var. granulata]|uniref:VQ domain-containing protein n=1 Tax=Oryza meyeriana var. granulata TaxID=110450 RepID=A0A6G1FBW6_9ORYZ|nr:hypothetical protein E2562_025530 [Oryza meyeriana var. granulata]
MERGCNGRGGVKVTFIETQFVTSDAAGFKSLVQLLTGNEATAIATGGAGTAPPLRRPQPCRADGWRGAGADGPRGGEGYHGGGSATVGLGRRAAVPPAPWVDEMMLYDLAEMLCVDVGTNGGQCHGGGYGGFPC